MSETILKHALFVIALTWGLALHAADKAGPPDSGIRYESGAANVGLASWYGLEHQGKIMANGDPFDSRALTTASRTLPLGSWIRVFNLRNGKSVDVQVTDRGPNKHLRARILDVSEAAAKQLGFQRHGLTLITFVPLAEPNHRKDTSMPSPAEQEP